jgi:hypothetical protein
MRVLPLAAVLALAFGGGALAQEAIATADGSAAPRATTATADATADSHGDLSMLRDDPDATVMGPCGPTRKTADGKPDHAPHGQVEVGVGTGGYRHIGGVVCKPIGDNAAVTIAVDQTQWNGGRRRAR